MAKRTSVIISQSQSSNPAKRKLEEDIVTSLLFEPGIDVTVIPHLYDLKAGDTGVLALAGIYGNMVVCSWLFERAILWTLDRHGVRGLPGPVTLKNADGVADDEDENEGAQDEPNGNGGTAKNRVAESRDAPNRKIYCLDLRVSNRPEDFVAEIKRIHSENAIQIVGLSGTLAANPKPINGSAKLTPIPGMPQVSDRNESGGTVSGASLFFSQPDPTQPSSEQLLRMSAPTNDAALAVDGTGLDTNALPIVNRIGEVPDRRWYPVIDYSRCTNCMECIDFCLFGVYGIDPMQTILVEQPDNCRKGCPACSRVCPENAIMFPQHKTPAIAGSEETVGALKIDLSQLFGAPAENKSAVEVAAAERDEQLMLAGRSAVGLSVGIPKRHLDKPHGPRDRLDELIDQLESLDL